MQTPQDLVLSPHLLRVRCDDTVVKLLHHAHGVRALGRREASLAIPSRAASVCHLYNLSSMPAANIRRQGTILSEVHSTGLEETLQSRHEMQGLVHVVDEVRIAHCTSITLRTFSLSFRKGYTHR